MPSPLKALGASNNPAFAQWPQMLPGGHYLYFDTGDKPENTGVYAASVDKPSEPVKLLSTRTTALYVPGVNGKHYLLWLRGTTLLAQQLDVSRLQLEGEPYPVADPVANLFGLIAASVSPNGLLLYSAVTPLKQFTWVDRAGKKLATVGEPLDTGPYRLSPDGRRLAMTRASGLGADLWLMDVERGVPSRFTFDSGSSYPVWSPDGRTILYESRNKGLSLQAFNGAGGQQSFRQSRIPQIPTDWSRDGRFVLFGELAGRFESWAMPLTPDGKPSADDKPRRYPGGQFTTAWGRFSPDTRWAAYQSDESGRAEVYIDSFPEPHGKVQISTSGGTFPQWGPGGRELFYASPANKLMAVSLKVAGDSIEPSTPRELFAVPSVDAGINPYEAAPDGQRFLVFGTPQQAPQPLTVIVNWPALLKNGTAR
jgi:hypothetical protein